MTFVSVFNDVLGPVMRGPSSSHTAGAHGIGSLVRGLLGAEPTAVRVTFDPDGSMAPTWKPLGVMHHCNSRGVVCAAPTGGSAGTLPGVVLSLEETMGLSRRQIALALFAASAVGQVVANRATFAAEIAGCQVEIGVAGAMAAAAVVEAAGGSPSQAANAVAVMESPPAL